MTDSKDILKEIKQAAMNTWYQCEADFTQLCGPNPAADDIAECVFDADRILSFNPELSNEAKVAIEKLTDDEMNEICKTLA